jgi:hypothetical protein
MNVMTIRNHAENNEDIDRYSNLVKGVKTQKNKSGRRSVKAAVGCGNCWEKGGCNDECS